ncbi:MAG TPA: helix-turn-helix domain-containing protein [Paraburkholderia sp.]|uniref:helix-turn-helix domain-containing protein n=1 Tax=Paraburkholderia sp. TaxID=1926495 RepID=UPI002BA53C8E|nr:helix-turn-helix domain-containing protein [Paraburkholderia sp.]HTR05608.1 helix-turn-helix domain-containing protein [Paraburkholderia sp.]
MDTQSETLTYRFSTAHARPEERFDAWCADTSALFDIHSLADVRVPYDSSFDFTLLDQMMFGGRQWTNPSHAVVHAMSRSTRRIRSDSLDNYYLQVQISETFKGCAGKTAINVGPGGLCLLDLASPFELQVTTGDTICMVIPRERLPASAAHLHGRSLEGGMGSLLADYLRSLRKNLPGMAADEVSYAIQATRNMLQACLTPTPDTKQQACVELDALVVSRIDDHIDRHLLSPDLNPERICKDMGISRSKLYRLFEPTGGVMRLIQRKRLTLAREALLDPATRRRKRISEVAWRHGFVSEKHFSRRFKEEFGCTPSEISTQGMHETPGQVARAGSRAATRSSDFGEWMRQFLSP